jgi:hypothetical protein
MTHLRSGIDLIEIERFREAVLSTDALDRVHPRELKVGENILPGCPLCGGEQPALYRSGGPLAKSGVVAWREPTLNLMGSCRLAAR